MYLPQAHPIPLGPRRKLHSILLSALGISTLVLVLQQMGLFQNLEQDWLDQMAQLRPAETVAPPITLITMTEADIAQQQQWPLSDATLAQLLQQIQQAQPRTIGLNLYRDIAIEPGSERLQQVFQSMPNLIGIEKLIGNSTGPAIAPPPQLHQQQQIAASDVVLDGDGKIRRHLLSLRSPQGKTQLSLGARLAVDYLAQQGIEQIPLDPKGCTIRLGQALIQALKPTSGGYVRTDAGGYQILSNFLPQASMSRLTLSQVLAGEGTELMRDRIVLIGATAPSLQNHFYTSSTRTPEEGWSGLEIQADLAGQLVLAALQGRPLLRGLPEGLEWGWILLWAGVGAIVGVQLRSSSRALWFGVPLSLLGLLGISYGLLLNGWWAIAIAPGLACLGSALMARQLMLWQLIRQSQAQLDEYNRSFVTQLAHEVEARTRLWSLEKQDLVEAKEAAETANQTKSKLLALIGHELRTPLNSIVGYGQLMADEPALPEQYRTTVNTINHSSEYLLGLVNELLDFSKIEADQLPLNLRTVHLPSLLKQLEILFQLQAKQRRLRLRCSLDNTLPESVWVDEIKLRQVLINLLNNALKFTQAGHVILRAWGNGSMYFEVEDTGPGIPPAELSQIFEPFQQGQAASPAHSRTGNPQGMGLGLWITNSLVKLMGGELTVNSQVGRGTNFRVVLPLYPAPQTPHPEAVQDRAIASSPADFPLYRVLVVDDVTLNRRLLVKLLEEVGVEVREACSGEEAIALWQTWHPQLILMDMRMPGMDGYEAVRQIRLQEPSEAPPVPILAITANVLQSEHEAALMAGCQDMITKPFRRQDVLIKIANYLDSQLGGVETDFHQN